MDSRIQNTSESAFFRSQAQLQARETTGNYRGTSVRVADVDEVTQSRELAKALQAKMGLADLARQQQSKPNVSSDLRGIPLSNAQLNRMIGNFGGLAATTKLAAKYLDYFNNNSSKPMQNETTTGLMQHFAALKYLTTAARSGPEDFIARMTPVSDGNGSLQELADKLKEANDDPQKLQAALAEVGGLPSDADELFQMMKTLRFNPKQLGETLRQKQGLPKADAQQLGDLAEKAEEFLKNLELEQGSRIKAATHALDSGQQIIDPAGFAEAYVEVLHGEKRFSTLMLNLLEKHEPKMLPLVISQVKQTLGDEIRLDQERRSADTIKLEAIYSELSLLHISNTALERISRLVEGLNRVFGLTATAA